MATAQKNNFINLLNRKENERQVLYEEIDSQVSSIAKRQMIMTSAPDSLSDSELKSHRTEVKFKKFILYAGTLSLPLVALYYCKTSYRNVLLSGVVGYFLSSCFYNSILFSRKSSYSSEYAEDTFDKNLLKLIKISGLKQPSPGEFWNNLGAQPVDSNQHKYQEHIRRI